MAEIDPVGSETSSCSCDNIDINNEMEVPSPSITYSQILK